MPLYDDYNYKNIDIKIRLPLKQIREKNMSTWEIGNFVTSLNTYYYKAEVIDTIIMSLNHGIKPNNILIFDESFKLNNQYQNLHYIDCCTSQLKYLYTLGQPFSLFPNKSIIAMHHIFNSFRKMNEFLYKATRKKIPIRDIHLLYSGFLSHGSNYVINSIKELSSEILKKTIDKRTTERYYKLIHLIESIFQGMEEDWTQISLLNEKLNSTEWSDVDFQSELYKKYFKNFYSLLSHVHRPIVGILDEDAQTIVILCRAHINKKERNSVTLDVKSIYRNSPLAAIFEGGAKFYSTFRDEKRKDEIHKYQLQKEELQLKILEQQLVQENIKVEKEELEVLNKKIEILKKLDVVENSCAGGDIRKISNPYLRNQLYMQSENLRSTRTQLLQHNNFEIDILGIDILDVKA